MKSPLSQYTHLDMGHTQMSDIPDFMGRPLRTELTVHDATSAELADMKVMLEALRISHPNSENRFIRCEELLRAIESLKSFDRSIWNDRVRSIMKWSKSDFKIIIKEYRIKWYSGMLFFKDWVYVTSKGKYYNTVNQSYLLKTAFRYTHLHLRHDEIKSALGNKITEVVEAVICEPGKPKFFDVNGKKYLNSWKVDFM